MSTNVLDSLCSRDPVMAAQFGTEEACVRWIYSVRWPGGYRCGECERLVTTRGSRTLECACGKQKSVTAGTLFEHSKKPIRLWIAVIVRLMSSGPVNARRLAREFGLNHKTAWLWLHKLRTAMQLAVTRVPDDLPFEELAALPRREKERRLERWKTRGLLRLSWERLGRPANERASCCRRLDSFDWIVPIDWENDIPNRPYERWLRAASAAVHRSEPPFDFPEERDTAGARVSLFAAYHGGVKEKHLQAYLDEYAFLENRTERPASRRIETLAKAMSLSPARTYASVVGSPPLDVRRKIAITSVGVPANLAAHHPDAARRLRLSS